MNFVRNVLWECLAKGRERSGLTKDNKIFIEYGYKQIWAFWVIVKMCIIKIKTKANILFVSLKEERNQGSLIMH